MITLRTPTSPASILELLRRIHGDLTSAQGAQNAKEALDRYLFWAYTSMRVLGPHVRTEELDRLVTTRRFWALQSVIEPSDDSMIRHFINLEISERLLDFEVEIEDLRQAIDQWFSFGQSPLAAIVLDTNVLLEHHDRLAEVDWNTKASLRSDVGITLLIPLVVIDELDRLKLNNSKQEKGKPPLRTQARQALRTIEQHFDKPDIRVRLRQASLNDSVVTSDLLLTVLADETGHMPLKHVDSEIVDRATTLLPFVKNVFVATFDTALAFRTRQAKLKVCKFEYVPEVGAGS